MRKLLKRIISILICIALTVVAMPSYVQAASEEEVDRVQEQLDDVYWKALSASGRSTLQGYCGILAGWELYFLGVTERSITHNGNEMYDIMSQTEELCEGYSAVCYPASSYTIEEALNTITSCGTEDAYNIMVGFQWTNTAAGSRYGHVVVIQAVLDGIVYFTDCFYTSYNVNTTRAMCTIREFNDYYNNWTRFEGLIHFGNGGRVSGCDTYPCNGFIVSDGETDLWDAPAPTENPVRSIKAGERLYTTALCRNAEGDLFYRVVENGSEYFVAADRMTPYTYIYDGIQVKDIVLPEKLAVGQSHWLSGVIRSNNQMIRNVILLVTDAQGNTVMQSQIPKNSKMVDLGTNSVNAQADISNLSQGSYLYSIYCDVEDPYCLDGQVLQGSNRILMQSGMFTVGEAELPQQSVSVNAGLRSGKSGWTYENGSWYYYEYGAPRTGWFCYEGVDYYLQADGAAATGWQTINGKDRYFSDTGAMRTGWLETEAGTYYMLSNGAPAIGTLQIDGVSYVFAEDGKLQ